MKTILIILLIIAIIFLLLWVRSLRLRLKNWVEITAKIVSNVDILEESISTLAVYYNIQEKELKEYLERKKNESEKS